MSRLVDSLRRQPLGALALALVLTGGTAYAATQLPKDSVASKQIKNGSIKSTDIKDKSVTGTDLKDGSVTAADLKAGVVPTPTLVPPFAATSSTEASDAGTAVSTPLTGASVQVDMEKPGVIVATFTAEPFCANTQSFGTSCNLNMAVDGQVMDGESDDDLYEASEADGDDVVGIRTVTRTYTVDAGVHTVAPYYYLAVGGGVGVYILDNWNFVVEGHYATP